MQCKMDINVWIKKYLMFINECSRSIRIREIKGENWRR